MILISMKLIWPDKSATQMYKIHSLEIEADGMDKIDEKGIRGGGGDINKGQTEMEVCELLLIT